MRLQNQFIRNKRSIEYLNELESQCKGLEKRICMNAISVISKKIDLMEEKFKEELKKKDIKKTEDIKRNSEAKNLESLNRNLTVLENSFKNHLNSPDISTNDLISRKIEENYKLLDDLEKSQKPIFSIKPDIQNKAMIEDKIKEMDNKLGDIFSAYREKNKTAINYYSPVQADNIPTARNNEEFSIRPESEEETRERKKQDRLKELLEKLNSTEKRIKEIAGTILKNF
ncbi:MAG: hypothetical protein HY959_02915 [Ignavibacteriae bacterium]|nr:hypothetical protein [Ignavibacteriota bacterium]